MLGPHVLKTPGPHGLGSLGDSVAVQCVARGFSCGRALGTGLCLVHGAHGCGSPGHLWTARPSLRKFPLAFPQAWSPEERMSPARKGPCGCSPCLRARASRAL